MCHQKFSSSTDCGDLENILVGGAYVGFWLICCDLVGAKMGADLPIYYMYDLQVNLSTVMLMSCVYAQPAQAASCDQMRLVP